MKFNNIAKLHNAKMNEFQKMKDSAKRMKCPVTLKAKLNEVGKLEVEYLLDVFDVLKVYDENVQQNDLLYKYLSITNNAKSTRNVSLKLQNEVCKECNMYFESIEGFDTCYSCGKCVHNIHFADTLSYKELQEIEYKPHFNYEKKLHLSEWLDRFQSRENKEIPVEILDIIKYELKKERIVDYSNLTEAKLKSILKKIKMHEYYDNVINIINRLSGRPAFVLTPEVNTKIEQMFSQIQHPFQLYKPESRKNFLSYSYFLNKFFLILKLPEFSKYFPLLKSDDKLRQQDEIFCKIVNHMKKIDDSVAWEFYPSF
jgi:hypothetical protein